MQLEPGGKAIDLHHAGRNHSDNSLVLHVPSRRLIYVVDWIPVSALPFRNFADSYPDEWVDSLAWVESNLDFDLLVPGHGSIGTNEDVRRQREYLLDIMASIRAARDRGLADNSEAMIAAVRADLAPRYGSWAQFGPWLPENIEGLTRLGFSR